MTYAEEVALAKARFTLRIADISAYLNGGGPGGGERVLDLATYLSDFLVTLADDVLTPDEHLRLIHLLNDQTTYLARPGEQAPDPTIVYPPTGTVLAPGQVITVLVDATDADGSVSSVEILTGGGQSLGFATTGGSRYSLRLTIPQSVGNLTLVAKATDNAGLSATRQALVVVRVAAPAEGVLFVDAQGDDAVQFLDAVSS